MALPKPKIQVSGIRSMTKVNIESKCFQHECDHLDGITFNKRVSKLKWDMAKKKSEKIKKELGR